MWDITRSQNQHLFHFQARNLDASPSDAQFLHCNVVNIFLITFHVLGQTTGKYCFSSFCTTVFTWFMFTNIWKYNSKFEEVFPFEHFPSLRFATFSMACVVNTGEDFSSYRPYLILVTEPFLGDVSGGLVACQKGNESVSIKIFVLFKTKSKLEFFFEDQCA